MLPSLAALTFPEIDPVLVQIGPLAVRWYALAYIAGLVLGIYYIRKLDNQTKPKPMLSVKGLDDLMLYAMIGIILGGRLGYVLFYQLDYYMAYPSEIIAIWKGGMAFHGGLIGVIVALYFFAKKRDIAYLRLMDLIAVAAPIGLFFGRLANFINGELYGRTTGVWWGMIFPHGGSVPRHPSQLYQAALEGLVLLIILSICARMKGVREAKGLLSGIFLSGYACFRATAELFREPDAQLGFIVSGITMGQILCIPMAALGIYLIATARNDA
ncbi:MAG: prolipoprotein diacylglyceryl transferase [Rickettsiales bacterium]|nr:prolipoprotein diacylglyceryl transferase [Rickettsiales bacterium]